MYGKMVEYFPRISADGPDVALGSSDHDVQDSVTIHIADAWSLGRKDRRKGGGRKNVGGVSENVRREER